MHYYKRNIGDYYKKAGRLTMLQHGAYTLLKDACYDRETFPTLDEAIDWVWAASKEEIEAVEFVLNKFFCKDESGYFVQDRVQEELDKYHETSATNKRIANERETKRREKRTKRVQVVNGLNANTNEAPPNQEPLTKNQELETNNQELVTIKEPKKDSFKLPEFITQEQWVELQAIKKKSTKIALTPRARTTLVNGLQKIIDAGYTIEQVLNLWSEYPHWKTITLEYMNSKLNNASYQQSGPQQFSKVTQQNIVTAENWLRKKQNEPS